MGGVAGHLMHLYDNRDLTFNKISKILYKASSGELEGTEKTDGYNIYLGAVNGQARAARNKGDMQKGGMSMDDLQARVFQGGDRVKEVYVKSFDAFQSAIDSLNPQEQAKIFGPSGEFFYNTEIMGPGASNLLNYDANVITIHRSGHKTYNSETDKVEDVDVSMNSEFLDRVIDRFEQATADKDFNVQRTAVMNLEALDNDSHVKVALEKMKAAGFDGNMTIEDYLRLKIEPAVEENFNYLASATREAMVDRLIGIKGVSLTQITKGFPVEQKRAISSFIKENQKRLIGEAIFPLEKAIHDFAVKMLEGLKSAYILDNEAEVQRLKQEVELAIKSIHSYEGEGKEMAMDILYKQLQKLEHHDNITTPVEGFVFEYEGQLYKFTGNFAPINQLLGLFKYGRGKVPPIEKKDAKRDDISEDEGGNSMNSNGKTIAVVAGGFKPPHRGHMDMVRYYAGIADEVLVLVSKLPRTTLDKKHSVTVEDSLGLWSLYLDALGLDNVDVDASPEASPVGAAFKYLEFGAPVGSSVILGVSTKGNDLRRYGNAHKYVKTGVTLVDPAETAFNPVGEELSATDFREALAAQEDIDRFLPTGEDGQSIIDQEKVYNVLGFPLETMNRTYGIRDVMEVDYNFLEEAISNILDEQEPFQRKVTAKHKKNRLTTKGEKNKSAPYDIDPPEERGKSAPPIGEADELEEISTAGGPAPSIEGTAGGFRKKPKKKKKKFPPYMEMDGLQEAVEEVFNFMITEAAASKSYCKSTPCKDMGFTQKASCKSQGFKDCYSKNEGKDPKKGTGKKPKGSGRRLYTDEDPSDTVSVKFSTVQDIKDTLSKSSFKSKSHKRQSQIINLIHQRVRAAYNNAKDPKVKSRLKKAYDYAKTRKEASKRKTQRMNKSK